MAHARSSLVRARILVKAYPQPSQSYGETVCVAAVTEDGEELLRLYPIRYRRLPPAARFNRFDLVELRVERPKDDHRPESRHVEESSIRVIAAGDEISDESKVRLWRRHVAASLTELQQENRSTRRSLGIVRPDPESLRFFHRPSKDATEREREVAEALFQQSALFEEPLKPLQRPDLMCISYSAL